jgi:rubrerythrin
MFSLATIQRMNAVKERRKIQRRARAMNAKAKAHPKNAEKTGAAPEKCGYCGGSGWKSNDSYSSFECPWCDKGIVKPKKTYCSPAQDNLL